MTERDSLELLIDIRAKGQEQLAQLAKTTTQVEVADRAATTASKQLEDQTTRTAGSMTGAVLKAQLMASAIMQVAGAVKEYTVGSAQYAARTEQIAVVMDNLARVNGMNVQSVRRVADGIKELGITTQESRNIVNMMIGSQLDLAKSLDLTRMAQNAAKVAGISSSEALQRMTYAITSGQPEMLRTLGIAVSFENAYQRAAKSMGIAATALDEQTKLNIRLDAVLARSPLIDGSYVVSLTTAAGQMQSLTRYTDDLKNSLGNGLQPALFDVVTGMERLTKFAQENIDTFQQMTAGVTALGVAGAVFAATPFLPLPARGVVAGAAGVGTYLGINQDPVQANTEKYQAAFKKLDDQKKVMQRQLEGGLVDEKAFKRFADQIPAYRELLRVRFIEEQAAILKQRGKDPWGNVKGLQRSWNLTDGVTVTQDQMLAAMEGKPVPFDKSGLIAKNPLMTTPPPSSGGGKAEKEWLARQNQMQQLLQSLADRGLDPLARLIADTEQRLMAITEKYGPLTSTDAAYAGTALELAIIREAGKRKVEPEAVDLSTTGFQYGWQRPTAQTVGVDPQKNEEAIASVRERSVRSIQRYVQFQEQMVRLTAGPGGEAAAVNTINALRIEGAQREYDLSMKTALDRAKLEEAIDAARKDRLLQIAQMQQAELERYRQAAGSIYDAMVQKGMTGIQDFIKGQLHVVGRTIFQNLAVELFRNAKDALKLGDMVPGQVGKDGKLTGLGRVLKGTPFGVDESKLVLQQNTSETRLNTDAVKANTAALQQQGPGGAGAGAGTPEAAADALTTGKTASRFQRMLGASMAIGAGAYTAVQGVRQGGVRGGLNAAAGVAGGLAGAISSGLLGSSAASGPLAPILAGAAIAIPLITGLFGQNKAKFDREQTETLNRNRYDSPVATNRVGELRGGDVDYDFTGRLRTANSRPVVIQFNVNAMDVKSFLDRSGDIAEALHKELRNGHRVGLDIQAAVLGA